MSTEKLPSKNVETDTLSGENLEQEKESLGAVGRRVLELTRKLFAKKEKEPRVLTIEEKAKKKGYFWDENLGWVNKDGNQKPGFELDEKYPEIAEMYEKSVKKYFGRFDHLGPNHVLHDVSKRLLGDGQYRYKKRILEDVEIFQVMEEADWDNLNSIASRCGGRYSEAYDDLFSKPKLGELYFLRELDRNRQRKQTLDRIFDGAGQVDEIREDFLEYSIAPILMKFYSDEVKKPEFCDAIASFVRDGKIDIKRGDIIRGIKGVLTNGGGEYVGDFLELHIPIMDPYGYGLEKKRTKNRVLNHYVEKHGMKKTTGEAMRKIFELIDRDDGEIKGIGDDFADSREGFFGVEDYTVECFSVISSPREIDRLIRIHNEIPTTNFANREQNRKDAERLQSAWFFKDRTFIHEERPGVHEIIGAIVDYYDARGTDGFNAKEKVLKDIEEKYGKKYNLDGSMYDLSKYNEWAFHIVNSDGSEEGEKVIDVLRRLKKNTEPVPIETPETKYPELNQALEKVQPIVDEKTGEIRVSFEEVGDAVAQMNQILRENSGQLGIFPSTISAVVFLDKMAACALRGVDKKDWQELAFDPKFKEIVRFSQMTSSRGYDEREFEGFYDRFRTKCGEAFFEDGVDDEKVEDGYRILSARITQNAGELAAAYASDEKTKRFSGAVWSGNLTHELIGMFDKF